MTRSEERVRTGKEKVATGKARLRKWVETEDVNVKVPRDKGEGAAGAGADHRRQP